MRRTLGVVAVMAAGLAWGTSGRAQALTAGSTNGDPFFLYYGWFLPQQAAIAAQPRVMDTIQQNVAANQAYAQTNRSSLYDPNGGYGRFNPYATSDPFDPNARSAAAGGFGQAKMRSGVPTSNERGRGPALYFNRTSQYYPSMNRSGQGPNRNVFVSGRGVRGNTGMSMGMGMPGPR